MKKTKIITQVEKNRFLKISGFLIILSLLFGLLFYFLQFETIKHINSETKLFLTSSIVQGMSCLWSLLFFVYIFFLDRIMNKIGKLKFNIGFITVFLFFNIWIILAIILGFLSFLNLNNFIIILLSLFFCFMAIFGIILLTLMILILIYIIPRYN